MLLASNVGGSPGAGDSGSQEFTFTGSDQTFVVPDGVTLLTVDSFGAQGGGSNEIARDEGGKGGRIKCDLPVTPGETLHLFVGGMGSPKTGNLVSAAGYNGGGDALGHGGGGGGASDIRQGGTTLADRVIIAGGGGGQAAIGTGTPRNLNNLDGGIGGFPIGGTGATPDGNAWYPGTGGTQTEGGDRGPDGDSTDGSLGQGGTGATGIGSAGGGGGGGGYYGGGGGASTTGNPFYMGGNGGGGSGLTTGINQTIENGVQLGDGIITISWDMSVPSFYRELIDALNDGGGPSYFNLLNQTSGLSGIDWADNEVIPGLISPTWVRANDAELVVPSGALMTGTADMTCLLFCKITNVSDEVFMFSVREPTTPPHNMHSMSLPAGSNNCRFFWFHDADILSSGVNLRDGNMHMVAMVKDSSYCRGYVDGVPNGTPVARGSYNYSGGWNGAIGNLGEAIGGYGIDGSISTVAYYNDRALSASEIQAIWDAANL